MSRWNEERWQKTGTNGAGDPVYERGSKPEVAPAKKKAAPKKKS